ncbi:shikimate dehydrogenase [Microbacterium sp. CH12i]|uniref:shikimate dehydrogenase n=1 Tax=Microbacterium sp. CH12i TaxID=1479651 RepID=UPI000460AB38|nr:shikimate dehydrogenase [Microbacterium sp. CH12i]KDA04726.1 shikimate dehydrogenase [Microbacterium sp. CH12i]
MTLVGLVGEGITTSLTPPMHRQEAAHLGLDYEYRVLDIAVTGQGIDDLPQILDEIAAAGFDAMNVTHPFKQRIIAHLDELTEDAAELGAVNLVLYRDGRAIGHNTDWTGFRYAIGEGLASVDGERVLQIGAGGAGAATCFALLKSGVAELAVADLFPASADKLVERMREIFPQAILTSIPLDDLPLALMSTDGIVHATPTGMLHNPGLPFELDRLNPEAWVAEVVYLPLATQLVQKARARGHRVLDGGVMAVGQAIDSIRIITGHEPDGSRMRRHFLSIVGDQAGTSTTS